MPTARIIQLRELLSEKFPGLRTHLEDAHTVAGAHWPTRLPHIDNLLGGGLLKGAFTEIIADSQTSGSASLMRAILHRAALENQIVALVDGGDSLDVTQITEAALARLLWVRCRSAHEALKAADLLLRDNNLPLLLIDLINVPESQLGKVPATTWYRFQRLIEETSTVCLVFTPRQMVGPAEARITIRSQFSLNELECSTDELLQILKVEISGASRVRESVRENFA